MSNKYDNAWFNQETNEVHTPKSRMVYPTLLEPRGIKGDENSKPKFSVSLLIPKAANVDALKKLVADVATEKFGKDWQKKVKRLPLLSTVDYERLAEYAEAYPVLLRASANPDYRPYVFGPNAKRLEGDPSDIYSGRWAVASVRAYAYDTAGNKGVAFGLQRIQLLDHDERIAGGRVETASGFEAVKSPATDSAVTSDDLWA